MCFDNEFLEQLSRLVKMPSVSPMNEEHLSRYDPFFTAYGLKRASSGDFWVRAPKDCSVWIYTHVDTKPVGVLNEWQHDPFTLVQRGERLFGRGISDSKFQLLNALIVFAQSRVGFIVDGAEENCGRNVGKYLLSSSIEDIAVVDGSSDTGEEIFGGMRGQLDGSFDIFTGTDPQHPGRQKREDCIKRLSDILVETSAYHFNITRLNGGSVERSLTLENLVVNFDLRYTPSEFEWANSFVKNIQANLKQHYPPVTGQDSLKLYPLAAFSNPLGMVKSQFKNVWVLPGGRPDNKAHRPNENICMSQIPSHQLLLSRFKRDILQMEAP
jgi:acetylornithine deacetylase/succinyl-diaminopimelate desuccinylase-like protein